MMNYFEGVIEVAREIYTISPIVGKKEELKEEAAE
jgi:hypothetical protein